MTRILVIESDRHTLEDLLGVLPEEIVAVGADDALDVQECLAEEEPFDTFVVQGAMQDGTGMAGDIRTTLEFLRELRSSQPGAKVLVVTNMFDHGPEVEWYAQAFPGCQVFNKTSVLNGTTVLPV